MFMEVHWRQAIAWGAAGAILFERLICILKKLTRSGD